MALRASRETYRQFCPLAAGLDVVGDTATLLLICELLAADADLADLTARVPDQSPADLRERLDSLQDHGVVIEQSGRYHLTEFGEGLREPMQELSWWGFTLSLRSG